MPIQQVLAIAAAITAFGVLLALFQVGRLFRQV